MSEDQQAGRRATILAVVIVPDQQVEAGILLYNGRKEDYVWNSGDPHGCLLAIYHRTATLSGQVQQSQPEKGMVN